MKKGVLCTVYSLLLILSVLASFSVLSPVVYAPTIPNPPAPGEGLGDNPPAQTPDSEGYWLVCQGEAENACTYIPAQTDLTSAVAWDKGKPDGLFPLGVPKPTADRNMPMTLDLKYLYAGNDADLPFGFIDYIDAGQPEEFYRLKFVLTPLPFTTTYSTNVFSSHGTGAASLLELVNNYEGVGASTDRFLLSCNTDALEDLNDCIQDHITAVGDTDLSAIEFNILKHKSCADFADMNPQFCEGIFKTDANGDTPVETPGEPGYGGCYVTEYGETGGRDWISIVSDKIKAPYEDIDTASDTLLSPDFLPGQSADVRNAIGRCCGNEPEDFGALMKSNDDYFKNRIICVNDTTRLSPQLPAPTWVDPRVSGKSFRILRVDRPLGTENVSFDVISNSDSWFVCQGLTDLTSIYTPFKFQANSDKWDFANSGPLLSEFGALPRPAEGIEYGVTAAPEGGSPPRGPDGYTEGDSLGGGSDTSSASDIVLADDFENGIGAQTGASQVTPCDKDGDGYDGYWTIDPAETPWDKSDPSKWVNANPQVGPWKDSSGICDAPRPPYDCDDFNRTISPGTIDYCDGPDLAPNSVDNDCNITAPCIPGIPGEDPHSPGFNPETLVPRFICHDVTGTGSFAECCGWNLGDCSNPDKGRREGSAIHTLNEFTNVTFVSGYQSVLDANVVLKYGVKFPMTDTDVLTDEFYTLSLSELGFDEKIQDWSSYKTFEFDFYSTTSYDTEVWVGFLNPPHIMESDSGESRLLMYYTFPFKAKIFDYAVGDPKLRKWVHVVIPISDIFSGGNFKVDNIVFASNILKLYNDGQGPSVMASIPLADTPRQYSNVIGLDKLILKANDTRLNGAENYYCTGTDPSRWISDLDDSRREGGTMGEQRGKAACNSIPSYRWTGNYCCGDDNGDDTSTNNHGQSASKEWYNDTEGACWSGRYMANDERAMLLQYDMQDATSKKRINVSCSNYSCTYRLPQQGSVIIENPNTDTYGLSFVDGGITNIGNGGVAPGDAMLRAYDVPLQVQYHNGQFYTCNADDNSYLFGVRNTNPSDGLLLIKDPQHRFSSCQVKGIYFCDNINGSNHGWDSEPVLKYPKTNLTMRDGAQLEFKNGDVDLTIIPATNRIEAKSSYNLVRNGGFENV